MTHEGASKRGREPAEAAQERMTQAAEPSFLHDLERRAALDGAPTTRSTRCAGWRCTVRDSELAVIDPAARDEEIGAMIDLAGMWYWTNARRLTST
jgi:hypothetical protein